MIRRNIRLAGAAICLLAGLVGCAASGATGAPATGGVRAALAVPDQRLAKARTYPTAGIMLAPPIGWTASVTASAAYDLCRTGVAGCPDGQPTSVELAAMTDVSYGATGADGKLRQPVKDTLVWALSWRNIACPPSSGGAFVPGATRPSGATAPTVCDEVSFVDATSGVFLITYTGPAAP
jgi:hypothetical protein